MAQAIASTLRPDERDHPHRPRARSPRRLLVGRDRRHGRPYARAAPPLRTRPVDGAHPVSVEPVHEGRHHDRDGAARVDRRDAPRPTRPSRPERRGSRAARQRGRPRSTSPTASRPSAASSRPSPTTSIPASFTLAPDQYTQPGTPDGPGRRGRHVAREGHGSRAGAALRVVDERSRRHGRRLPPRRRAGDAPATEDEVRLRHHRRRQDGHRRPSRAEPRHVRARQRHRRGRLRRQRPRGPAHRADRDRDHPAARDPRDGVHDRDRARHARRGRRRIGAPRPGPR